MMLDKSWLYKRFTKNEIPDWRCPTCNSGTLCLDGDFVAKETSSFQKVPDSIFDETTGKEAPFFKGDLSGLKERFIGFLKCSSKKCNEAVTIAGFISTEHYYSENSDEFFEPQLADFFYPLQIDPPVHIIPLHSKYPQRIIEQLQISFALYWRDNFSCANKIRSVIELLLDDLRVPKRQRKKDGSFAKIRLHDRLKKYGEKNVDVAEFLMSIKWIGNSGSHLEILSNKNVLDAFYMLDHALNQIYIKRNIELKRLSKNINKKKKPLP